MSLLLKSKMYAAQHDALLDRAAPGSASATGGGGGGISTGSAGSRKTWPRMPHRSAPLAAPISAPQTQNVSSFESVSESQVSNLRPSTVTRRTAAPRFLHADAGAGADRRADRGGDAGAVCPRLVPARFVQPIGP